MLCQAMQCCRYTALGEVLGSHVDNLTIRISQENSLRRPYLKLLNHYKSARYCNMHYVLVGGLDHEFHVCIPWEESSSQLTMVIFFRG